MKRHLAQVGIVFLIFAAVYLAIGTLYIVVTR